jgi:NTP pyrophosphatase (non-canonical NTP hydrolase)
MEQKITEKNYPDANFSLWQEEFAFIYRHDHAVTLENLWLNTVDLASQVGEAIRKKKFTKAREYATLTCVFIMRTFARINNPFSNPELPSVEHLKTERFDSLDKIIWFKVPGYCYRCIENPCVCESSQKKEEEIEIWGTEGVEDPRPNFLTEQRANIEDMPSTPEGWFEMLDKIYVDLRGRTSIAESGFHFLEEIGEVARALTNASTVFGNKFIFNQDTFADLEERFQREFYEELADSLTWIFTIVSEISKEQEQNLKDSLDAVDIEQREHGKIQEFANPKTTLARLLWEKYNKKFDKKRMLVCYLCGERPCLGDHPLVYINDKT